MLYMDIYIYGNIDHQYSPVLLASIYHTYGSVMGHKPSKVMAYDAHLAGIHQFLIINPHARARTAIDFSLQRTTSHALGTCQIYGVQINMYIYIYPYINMYILYYMYMYMDMYMYMLIYVYMYLYIDMYMLHVYCLCICPCICIQKWSMSMFIYRSIYLSVYLSIYIYQSIYLSTSKSLYIYTSNYASLVWSSLV